MFGKREEMTAEESAVIQKRMAGMVGVEPDIMRRSMTELGGRQFYDVLSVVMILVKERIGGGEMFKFITSLPRMFNYIEAWNSRFPDLSNSKTEFDRNDRRAVEEQYAFIAYHIDKRSQN